MGDAQCAGHRESPVRGSPVHPARQPARAKRPRRLPPRVIPSRGP